MPVWPFRRRRSPHDVRRTRVRRSQRPSWELELGLVRLEPRRVLTVNAMLAGAGDVLEVQLSGANEAATITVNAADEIEVYDGNGNQIQINGQPSVADAAINQLRIDGDNSMGQDVTLNSATGEDLVLNSGMEVDGVESLNHQLDLLANNDVVIDVAGDLAIGAASSIQVSSGQLLATSGDISIATSGLLQSADLHLQPQSGVSIGIGQASMGDWQLDLTELTFGIESTGVLTIGRPGGSEAVNIRNADLSGESYDVVVHGADIQLGGEGVPHQPSYADNTAGAPVDGTFQQSGFIELRRNRCLFGSTHLAFGDSSGDTATWQFTNLEDGEYQLATTWCQAALRASNAPYTISGTGFPPTTVLVDQSGLPNDFNDSLGAWEVVTTFRISGGAGAGVLTVSLSDDANGVVMADGVRIVRNEPIGSMGPDIDVGSRSLRLVAQGSIVDLVDTNPDTNDIVAGQASLESTSGVGLTGGLETTVATLAATASVDGGVMLLNHGDLSIGATAIGASGIRSAGPVDITATGSLSVDAVVESFNGDPVTLESTAGDMTIVADVQSGLGGTGGGQVTLRALNGKIEGPGRVANRTGNVLVEAQAVGVLSPLRIGAGQFEATATSGGVRMISDQATVIGNVDGDGVGIDAAGDVAVSSDGILRIDEQITTQGGQLNLSSNIDVELNGDILPQGGNAVIEAGRDVKFLAGTLLDGMALGPTGTIQVTAGQLVANGRIVMEAGARIDGGAGQIQLQSTGDQILTRVETTNSGNAAISAVSTAGRLLDVDDAQAALNAPDGRVSVESHTGIHREGNPSLPFVIDAQSLGVVQSMGQANLFDPNQLNLADVTGNGLADITIGATDQIVVLGSANVTMTDGDLDLRSDTAAISIDGSIQSNSGDVAVVAAGGIALGATGNVVSASGSMDLVADDDGVSTAGVTMSDGSRLDVGLGQATITSRGDVVLSQVAAASSMPLRTSVFIDTQGAVVDGGDALFDLDIGMTRADLRAGMGIGAGNALETASAALQAIALNGPVVIDNQGDLTLEGVDASDTVQISTLGSLLVESTGVVGGTVSLQARGASGDLEVMSVINGATAVDLSADRSLLLQTMAVVESTGPVTISADINAANNGQILMFGAARIDSGSEVELNAASDIVLTDVNAVTDVEVNTGGRVLNGGGGVNVEAGQFRFDAAGGVGNVVALETSVDVVEGQSSDIAASIRVNNQRDTDVEFRTITGAGNIAVSQAGDGNLTLAGDITTGNGGSVQIVSEAGLTATALVSTANDGLGAGSLRVEDANLAAGFDVQLGVGDILLRGAGPDLHVAASLALTNSTELISQRDVVVSSELLLGPSASLSVLADNDNDDVGGVHLTGAGAIVGSGQVDLQGADVFTTSASDGIRIDADPNGGVQLQAAQSVLTTTAGDLLIDGRVRGGVVAQSQQDIRLDSQALLEQGDVTLSGVGPDSDLIMDSDASISAGNNQVLVQVSGDAILAEIGSTSATSNAVTLQAAGDLRDANGDLVNVAAANGGVVLTATKVGLATDRIEVDTNVLRVDASSDAFIHGQSELILEEGLSLTRLDITANNDLTVGQGGAAAPEIDLQSDQQVEINGQVEANNVRIDGATIRTNQIVTAASLLQMNSTVDMDIAANASGDNIELLAMGALNVSARVTADDSILVDVANDLTMNAGAAFDGTSVSLETGADAALSEVIASSTSDDAIRIVAAGEIRGVGANVVLQAPSGGAALDAGAGVGPVNGLATDLASLSLVNRSGDVNLFDDGDLTVTSALQQGTLGEDLTIVAENDLTIDGAQVVVDAATGETNLISENDRIIVNGQVQGAERVVLTADRDVLLNVDSRLQSVDGNVGVLADFSLSGTGGRIVMADGAEIHSENGLVAMRAGGDVQLGGVSSNFDGAAVRIESVNGAIVDGGDTHAEVATPGGVQLLAATGVGVGNPLELAVQELAADAQGGFEVADVDDLMIGRVGALDGVTSVGRTEIAAPGEIAVESAVATDGDLMIEAGGALLVNNSIAVTGSDGDLNLRSGGDLIVTGDPSMTEIASTGTGIVRLDSGGALQLDQDTEIRTDTGFFQSLPLIVGDNVDLAIINQQGDVPLAPDGTGVVQIDVGEVGDTNFLLDVTWLDGSEELSAREQVTGVPGGRSEITHRFRPNETGLTVVVTFGLDPRNGAGGLVEGVQLFSEGEPIRPTISQTRTAFGLGVDTIVLTFESEVEPVEERPRPIEPPLVVTSASRTDVNSSFIVEQSSASTEVQSEEYVFFRKVDEATGEEAPKEYRLTTDDLQNLHLIPDKYNLRNGHYRIYIQAAGATEPQKVFDIHVYNQRLVPENHKQGASERPPQQPEVEGAASDPAADTPDMLDGPDNESGKDDAATDTERPEVSNLGAASLGLLVAGRRRVARSKTHSKAARMARRIARRQVAIEREQCGVDG